MEITTQLLIDMVGAGLFGSNRLATLKKAEELTLLICKFAIKAGYIITYSYLLDRVVNQYQHNWS